MELVPGKLREFRQRGYWTRFYAERASEEVMEWYVRTKVRSKSS